MIQFQHTTEIDRSPADVFAFLTDVERAPSWQRSVTAVKKTTAGPLRAGSEIDETWKVMGRRRDVSMRVAAFRQDELIAFAGDAGFADYYCAFELIGTAGNQTRVMSRGEFQLHGLWKLVRPMLAREIRRETAGELAELKRLIEARAPAFQASTAS